MMRVEINSLGEIISRGDKYLVHCYRDLFLVLSAVCSCLKFDNDNDHVRYQEKNPSLEY